MFWTLDLNRTRYIVKPFSGKAQGGMRYLYWAGPGRDFEQKPLAISFISPSQAGATIPTREDGILPNKSSFAPVNRKRSIAAESFESSDSSDSTDASDSGVERGRMRGADTAQRVADIVRQFDDSISNRADHDATETNALKHQTTLSNGPSKRRKTEVSSREIEQLYRVSPPARRRSDAQMPIREHLPEPAQLTPLTLNKPVNDREERRKQRAIGRIEKDLKRKFDQIFTPWAGADQDVSRNTLQMILKVISLMEDSSPQMISRTLNKALNGGDGKRQAAGGKKPTRPCFKALALSFQDTKTASVNDSGPDRPSPPLGSNLPQPDQRSLQRPEAVSAGGTGPETRSVLLDGNRHQLDQDQDLDMSPSVVLPQEKQRRTTFVVRVAPSLEYIPLRLTECMTPQAFYAKTLGAWGIGGESVAKMTVTFTWMDPSDTMRTMAMNSQIEGCFAHLIEQVDEAPIWEEKGKCVLDVEIMRKE